MFVPPLSFLPTSNSGLHSIVFLQPPEDPRNLPLPPQNPILGFAIGLHLNPRTSLLGARRRRLPFGTKLVVFSDARLQFPCSFFCFRFTVSRILAFVVTSFFPDYPPHRSFLFGGTFLRRSLCSEDFLAPCAQAFESWLCSPFVRPSFFISVFYFFLTCLFLVFLCPP